MKGKSYSNIFTLVAVAAIVLLIGKSQLKAEVHYNLLDNREAALLDLHGDKILLDRHIDALLPDGRILNHQKIDILDTGVHVNRAKYVTARDAKQLDKVQKHSLISKELTADILRADEVNKDIVKKTLFLDDRPIYKVNGNKLLSSNTGPVDGVDPIRRHDELRSRVDDRSIIANLFDDRLQLKGGVLRGDADDDLVGKSVRGLDDPVLDHVVTAKLEGRLNGSGLNEGILLDADIKSGLVGSILLDEKKTLDVTAANSDEVLHLNDLALNNGRDLLFPDNEGLLNLNNDRVNELDANVLALNATSNRHLDLGILKNRTSAISHDSALSFPGGADSILGLNSGGLVLAGKLDTAKKKDNLRKDVIANLEWLWKNDPVSILNAMETSFTDKDAALGILKKALANDPRGVKSIELGASSLPDFWDLPFSGPRTKTVVNTSALDASIKWAYENNWAAMNSSRESWNSNPRNERWAYYKLLKANEEEPRAIENLRGWWNQDKEWVMSSVEKWWKR